jgi:hypothetical protein
MSSLRSTVVTVVRVLGPISILTVVALAEEAGRRWS